MGSKPLFLLSTVLCDFCKFISLLCYGFVLHFLIIHVNILSFSEHLLLDQPPWLVTNKMSFVFLYITCVLCLINLVLLNLPGSIFQSKVENHWHCNTSCQIILSIKCVSNYLNLVYIALKHILFNLTSFINVYNKVTENSTQNLPPNRIVNFHVVYKYLITFCSVFCFLFQLLMNAEYRISSLSVTMKSTLMILNSFIYTWR